MIKACEYCGKSFETKVLNTKYCSRECYKEMQPLLRESRITRLKLGVKKCFGCGKMFRKSFAGEKFCSDKCRLNYFKL